MPERHPSVSAILRYFTWTHLPTRLHAFSKPCCDLAEQMADICPENPELTAGLRKLLEAKDCFVRAALSKEE